MFWVNRKNTSRAVRDFFQEAICFGRLAEARRFAEEMKVKVGDEFLVCKVETIYSTETLDSLIGL